MYYAVLRKEVKMPYQTGELTLRVGGVYEVTDQFNDETGLTTILYRSVDLDADVPEPYGEWFTMPLMQAREYFTQPYHDLNTVIEESFLVCEAAYC